MSVITLDEKNKKRIQRYIKQEIGFYGHDQDIAVLEQKGQLTEGLAREVFTKIMNDAHRIRNILEPEETDEFKDLMEETYSKYDSIHKPENLKKYGYYYGSYAYMNLDEIYANMQIAFEVKELDAKYYECRDMRGIANAVINSIDGIERYKIELQPQEKEELQRIQEELRTLLSAERTDIKGIQDRVDLYNGHAIDIWNDYLTDVNDTNSSEYRWVVHNLTKGELKGEFKDKYMSTSLITNNAMGLYGRSNYGLIIKPKHIISASYKDSYTYNTRDDEENLYMLRRPPIMLPQEIEEICIQQTIKANGERLNYEKEKIYPEIVVDDFEIIGMYYISNGEQEFAENYQVAKKMADERGLTLKERDISKYREELGLAPMTERAKRNLCSNILKRCCAGDKELEKLYNQFSKSFVDNHFQEFYEQFMRLKANPEFSKEDILRTFSDVARGDIDFGKISENIDEMYMSDEEKQMLRTENEYGLANINDGEILKKRLEKIISDGINYGANKEDPEAMRRFGNIKKIMPQFEMFKETYLQLRGMRLEEKLYVGLDFEDISYDKILERAKSILEEKAKVDVERTKLEQPEVTTEKQSEVVTNPEQVTEESIENEPSIVEETIEDSVTMGANIESDNASMMEAQFGYMRNDQDPQPSQVLEDYWNEIHSQQLAEVQEPNQAMPSVDLWMNRFKRWNGAIDRVLQSVKGKFVEMKSKIIAAINEKLKERTSAKYKNHVHENREI